MAGSFTCHYTHYLNLMVLIALSTARINTPTSPKIASQMLAKPKAPKSKIPTLISMTKYILEIAK